MAASHNRIIRVKFALETIVTQKYIHLIAQYVIAVIRWTMAKNVQHLQLIVASVPNTFRTKLVYQATEMVLHTVGVCLNCRVINLIRKHVESVRAHLATLSI